MKELKEKIKSRSRGTMVGVGTGFLGSLAWIFVAVGLTGCGSSASKEAADAAAAGYTTESWDNGTYESVSEDYDYADEEMAVEETSSATNSSASSSDSESLENTAASNRKLIRRVDMSVETQSFSEVTQSIQKRVEELGGYMESSDIYSGSYRYDGMRNAQYTARVPADKLDELVNAVAEVANVTNKSESATDVTLQYVDTKSQKEALVVEQERLMEILEKAEDVDTIVALESRLTEVRYQIQNLESQLRTYDNLVDYATVSISVSEVEVYTPQTVEEKSDFTRMTEGFVSSIKRIGRGLKNFVIDFVIVLPYIILWALIILLCVIIIKNLIKALMKRRERKKEGRKNGNGKENRLCDADRETERREVNADEPADRPENSDHVQ
jgi:hypothetical protein